MKILELSTENFRLHASTEIAFPERGTVGIVGSNESGKSTLLEAIAFALFGASATRGKKSSLRWTRAPARKPAAVTLAFEVGGAGYRIERTESDAKLFEAGQEAPIAAGTSAVDAFVPELLGMSLDEFRATYMCSQRDLDRLGAMGPTERRQFYLRVLGIGQIDEALTACRKRKNELAHEVAGMSQGLGDREGLEGELGSARDAVAAATVEHESADAERTAARVAAETATSRLRELEHVKAEHHRMTSDRTSARASEETAAGEVARLEEGLGEIPDAPDTDAIAGLRARRDEIAELLASLHDTRTREKAGHDAARSAVERVHRAALERERRIRELGAEAECPTCTARLGDRYETVLAAARREIDEAAEAIIEHADGAHACMAKGDGELAAEVDLEAVTEQLRALEARAQESMQARRVRAELERWRGKLESVRQVAGELEVSIDALGFDPEDFEERRTAYERTVQTLRSAESRLAAASASLRAARERQERAQAALAAYEKRAAALESIQGDLRTHERASDGLQEFRTLMAGGIQPDLEALASGFIQILTDGRHEGLLIGDDFEARLLEDGQETEVVSGGTEDLTAIAMRLAVSQMIAERAGHPLSLLILDEPFGSLDVVRRGNVLTLIERLRSVFDQVIIISHVDETREACDHVIEVAYSESEGRAVVTSAAERAA